MQKKTRMDIAGFLNFVRYLVLERINSRQHE